MSIALRKCTAVKPIHLWLRRVQVAFIPGPMTFLLEEVMDGLKRHLRRLGHRVQTTPDDRTDAILTTARFGEPLGWRQALLFTAHWRFNLSHTPTLYTLVQMSPAKFQQLLDHFQTVLAKEPPNLADYDFPGLAPQAYRVLFEQGQRGGPILALERLVQAQTKSIQVLLVVGDDRPLVAYHFDLVGAHPRSETEDPESFYEDIVLRLVTTLSTSEVNQHQVVEDPIPRALWERLSTPAAMRLAGQQLGERNFFTEMVRIADLVQVPAVSDAVASQYSEGCFATWDPTLGALIATVTGSARPVDKGSITEDDLAVIVGIRSDGQGALVRHVEVKRNDPPSVEAVEMMNVDRALPTIVLGSAWDTPARVPVVRSRLHGHRGIAAYDPRRVEYVPLDPPYYHYLVSCGTEAQAQGIKAAFARSEALQNPEDPRQVVFTVLPGHGVAIVEKWVPGRDPFQVIWESMDAGYLEVDTLIPQGPMEYVPDTDGRMLLRTA
ncbi:MAG: hypothetical protein H8D78_01235 [Chloroflexi bacterium]|nr:hypothetical protein [Chloroflexota bacterium]